MVKSLQDVCVLKPYCSLKGRWWWKEGARAWACVFLLGEAGAGLGNKPSGDLRHGVGALGQFIFHGKSVGGAGRL